MASKDFSNKLKDLRLKAGYSQKDVYEHFKIPQSTFSSWEVGKSEPSGEMLIKLCEFYKCDMVKEFSTDEDLNYKEWNMIEIYRSLDNKGKAHIDYELSRESERVNEVQKQSEYIKELKTPIVNNNEPNIDMRLINYYYRVASAGTGQIIFDMPPTKRIEIPNTLEYRKVDYAIGVNGNSMEPLYHDGDMLLVEMAEDIEIGEIGIFRVDNESYVKKLGETELISLNPNARNIPLNESAGCMGKVVGKFPNDTKN